MKKIMIILFGASLFLTITSCSTKAGTGALVGGGLGTGAGALIGGGTGAAIGAAAGTVTGALVGNSMDRNP